MTGRPPLRASPEPPHELVASDASPSSQRQPGVGYDGFIRTRRDGFIWFPPGNLVTPCIGPSPAFPAASSWPTLSFVGELEVLPRDLMHPLIFASEPEAWVDRGR